MKKILRKIDVSRLKMLHFAPEPFFRVFFEERFGEFKTADLNMQSVDYPVDIQNLPFKNGAYDLIYASHMLEHIPDDHKAVREIRRILKPSGIAVLPVPVIAEKTIEYPEPNPHEPYHSRAQGADYFGRHERYFSRVEKFSSDSFPNKYQLLFMKIGVSGRHHNVR